MADGLNRTVHSRVEKTSDVEIHVATLVTDSGRFTEIREYIKSLDQYGRGITFPQAYSTTETIMRGLADSDGSTLTVQPRDPEPVS
jgi:hypothetical protein